MSARNPKKVSGIQSTFQQDLIQESQSTAPDEGSGFDGGETIALNVQWTPFLCRSTLHQKQDLL